MNKELKSKIEQWVKDFETTQPGNVSIDEDTFEGSAYYLFKNILAE